MSNVFSGVCNVSQDATVNYLPGGQAVAQRPNDDIPY